MRAKKNSYTVFVGNPEGRRPLERPRCRWEDKMDLRAIEWGSMDWVNLAQDMDQWKALLNTVVKLQVP
jgi:hypothetical protein